MAEHKYTSLSDLLKDQPPKPSTVESDQEFPPVFEMFGELYFRESKTPTSIGDLKFSPPLPLPKVSSKESASEGSKDDDVNRQNKLKSPVKTKNYFKNDSCMYNYSEKRFPPPISTLRMSTYGKPFTYKRFDEKANASAGEEIRIDPRGVMAASRENGRLRMKFVRGPEEDEKATEAAGNDDE
ncbi:uncharacterized protein LOC113755859 [Coffea eugenioides]|uniref:uncharacterized protein LOC113755859 n=1 Tax=Coffea eugenioides TaxID=49369 RepID=UPI000F5CEB2E|nr:uncharacterized protein LOC113728495 [Coffea arabica]XP_027155528.1 uncharacterized protein LOC113755859 [Coffea eugenioides]